MYAWGFSKEYLTPAWAAKLITILGTRPEIIRLSRVIKILDSNLNHIVIDTGQNSDFNLNGIFFKELGLKETQDLLQLLGNFKYEEIPPTNRTIHWWKKI